MQLLALALLSLILSLGCSSASLHTHHEHPDASQPLNVTKSIDDGSGRNQEGRCVPRQVHLALSEDDRSMRVVWVTDSEGCPSVVSYGRSLGASATSATATAKALSSATPPAAATAPAAAAAASRTATPGSRGLLQVATETTGPQTPRQAQGPSADLGDGPGGQWLTQEGDSYSLTERQMCSGRARKRRFRKMFHTAVMDSLEPDTEYQYRIEGSSTLYTFRSRPEAGERSHLTFVAFGDMGYAGGKKSQMAGETFDAISREHAKRPLDLVLHVGDLAYADGIAGAWDSFMEMIEPLAAELPYMVAIGNHEYAYAGPADNDPSGVDEPYRPDWGNFGSESGGECGAMLAHHFMMPSPSGAVNQQILARGRAGGARGLAIEGTEARAGAGAGAGAGGKVEVGASRGAKPDAAPERSAPGGRRRLRVGPAAAPASLILSAPTLSATSTAPSATSTPPSSSTSMPPSAASSQSLAPAPSKGPESVGARSPPPDNAPFWYSYDFGIAHFTVLSSEHDLSHDSVQHRWLQADLASVDRCSTPWLIVAVHRPMYVVYPHKSNRDVGEHLREFLEDLLLEYRVDLVLSGHVHSYYRSCSVRQEVCTDDGTGMTHLVIGTGGHSLSAVDSQQRLWCRAAATDIGFGHFSIKGDRLRFKFIRSEDGEVLDEVALYSQVPRGECTAFMASKRAPGAPAPAPKPGDQAAPQGEAGARGKGKGGKGKADKALRKAMHTVEVVDRPERLGGRLDTGEHSDDGEEGGGDRRRVLRRD